MLLPVFAHSLPTPLVIAILPLVGGLSAILFPVFITPELVVPLFFKTLRVFATLASVTRHFTIRWVVATRELVLVLPAVWTQVA
jgi:hypothetical protein